MNVCDMKHVASLICLHMQLQIILFILNMVKKSVDKLVQDVSHIRNCVVNTLNYERIINAVKG